MTAMHNYAQTMAAHAFIAKLQAKRADRVATRRAAIEARELVRNRMKPQFKRRSVHTFRKGHTGALAGASPDGRIRALGIAMGCRIRKRSLRKARLMSWAKRKQVVWDNAEARAQHRPYWEPTGRTLFDVCTVTGKAKYERTCNDRTYNQWKLSLH